MSSAIRTYHYLDACVLAGWCCAAAQGAAAIDLASAAVIGPMIEDETKAIAISELTIIEVHDTLAKCLRASDKPAFTTNWFEAATAGVMELLASGRIRVVQAPPKVAEHAMALVTLVSRDHRQKLKAWDATHLITAAAWARAVGSRVEVVTADVDFTRFFALGDYFKTVLDLRRVEE